MRLTCLIAYTQTDDHNLWSLAPSPPQELDVVILRGAEGIDQAMLGKVAALVVVCDSHGTDVAHLLSRFVQASGFLPEAICIIADSPTPLLFAAAYEFGVETICTPKDGDKRVRNLCAQTALLMAGDTPESRIFAIARSIRAGEQSEIQARLLQAQPMAAGDYRVSYQIGQAHEALGAFTAALTSYHAALLLNGQFRLGQTSLAECQMVMGRTGEALQILLALTATNPTSGSIKAQLAAVQAELGHTAQAKQLIQEAKTLGGAHTKILEAKAQLMLAEGDMASAFRLMDDMTEVGPFFAAKLNELGIKLSQAGKGKSALALYQKAHKIVRPELKYKISLNAALACRRLSLVAESLRYLDRCQSEFGGPFPKLEKIRLSLMRALENETSETHADRDVS